MLGLLPLSPHCTLATAGCLDSHIPGLTDLMILEQNEHTMGFMHADAKNAERLLWRLHHHFRSAARVRGARG